MVPEIKDHKSHGSSARYFCTLELGYIEEYQGAFFSCYPELADKVLRECLQGARLSHLNQGWGLCWSGTSKRSLVNLVIRGKGLRKGKG